MYHYIEDKVFLSNMRELCGGIMQRVCRYLKQDFEIGAIFYLVGSGARNMILQNADNPVDLDYNLEIVKCENYSDCKHLKKCVIKAFSKCLDEYDLRRYENSTSSIKSPEMHFTNGNNTRFSMDICITCRDDNDNYYRLIHKKTGFSYCDEYWWSQAPCSRRVKEKAKYIKQSGKWEMVRKQYLDIKNMYLKQNDIKNHPSFVCYIEAVNNVYNTRYRW